MAESTATPPDPIEAAVPQLLDIINTGAFGQVYRGALDTGEIVAVKAIPLKANTNWQALQQELQLCRQLQHPYIAHTYDIIYTDAAVYVIQEYCARGDLFEVVAPLVGIADEQRIKKYFCQLVDATAYLHAMGQVHRDIKPENVVLSAEDDVRLIDFGLSGPEDEEVEPCVGTVPYMAPEVYLRGSRSQKYSGKAADVYSLGIVLYVMIRGCYPWDAPSRHEPAFDDFVRNGFSFCQDWSAAVDELFRGCLHIDPQRRLTAVEVLDLVNKDTAWHLPGDGGGGYTNPSCYSVVPENQTELLRSQVCSPGEEVDIVFAEDFRPSEQSSTDEDWLDTLPETFNPLVDLPRRRTRLASECDSGLEIHFDADADSDRVHWATSLGPSSLSDIDDEEDEAIPRWSWRDGNGDERDPGNQFQSKQGHALWSDLNKDMSFATIPAFDDPLPQHLQSRCPSLTAPLSRYERSTEDGRKGNPKWGDMSLDMSFSTFPKFEDSLAGAGPLPSAEPSTTLPRGRCLFSVGEDDDFVCDNEEGEGVEEEPDTDTDTTGSEEQDIDTIGSEVQDTETIGSEVQDTDSSGSEGLEGDPVGVAARRTARPGAGLVARHSLHSVWCLQPGAPCGLGPRPSLSGCLAGCCAEGSTCHCWGAGALAQWCVSALNLRKAVSCINLATC